MALSDPKIKNAKPGITPDKRITTKPYKMADGGGLYLEVHPKGGKWWRFKYRFGGKEKRISVGVYDDVSLSEARDRRDEFRKMLRNGIDPGEDRKAKKEAALELKESTERTFETVGREWHRKHSPKWSERHRLRLMQRLERDIFPYIGGMPISLIRPKDLKPIIKMVEDKGFNESAHRVLNLMGQVFKYAGAEEYTDRNPAGDLHGALAPVVVTHRASITDPRSVGPLLRAIDGYQGYFSTKCALRLAPLVFVRPGELRAAEWAEFDLERAEWRIPAARMKMRSPHIVPLSSQAVEIIRDLEPLTGNGKYLFPSMRTASRPMSENTINAALRRLGYAKDEMTGHGFRSLASTLLNEMSRWHDDAIERQLAHGERNGVRASYNFAEHLTQRREMMQVWADYLYKLKGGR